MNDVFLFSFQELTISDRYGFRWTPMDLHRKTNIPYFTLTWRATLTGIVTSIFATHS